MLYDQRQEYKRRFSVWKTNVESIFAHNRLGKGYTVRT